MVRKIGRKRKRRARRQSLPKGPTPGIRMKGGIRFDPAVNGFVVIVHRWDNVQCIGEPEEWRYDEVFPTEEAAMEYYKTSIRPSLEQFVTEMSNEYPDQIVAHRRLEE